VGIEYLDLFIDTKDNKEQRSITIRLVMQSFEKTLSENEINSILDTVLSALKAKLQVILKV
jgi:phenylalanyl-tRNA synthetase beta subunit